MDSRSIGLCRSANNCSEAATERKLAMLVNAFGKDQVLSRVALDAAAIDLLRRKNAQGQAPQDHEQPSSATDGRLQGGNVFFSHVGRQTVPGQDLKSA